MNRVLALAPIGFLVACSCTRDRRAEEPTPEPVAWETPRWTLVPLGDGERPELLIVDWDVARPAARRVDWDTGRALVMRTAPREAGFRVFRRTTFEWLVPADLEVSPRAQVVEFLGGAARDVDVRHARVHLGAAEMARDRDLARRLQTRALELTPTGSLTTH